MTLVNAGDTFSLTVNGADGTSETNTYTAPAGGADATDIVTYLYQAFGSGSYKGIRSDDQPDVLTIIHEDGLNFAVSEGVSSSSTVSSVKFHKQQMARSR